MNRFLPYLLLCLLGLTSWNGGRAEGAKNEPQSPALAAMPVYQWQKSCNSNGLTIYWSKVEGSPIIAFKGEGIVDAPLEKVASIIIDTTRGTEWIDSLMESKVVRSISPTEFIEYDHVGTPFIMANRDFVSHVTVEADAKTRRMVVRYTPTEDPLAPPLKKYVRGVMVCEFRMVPMSIPEETYVEAEIHCDPKGSVPKWIVNLFQEGWPQTTFESLRKQAKKTDISILPVVENLLNKPSMRLAKDGR
jgi:START domain